MRSERITIRMEPQLYLGKNPLRTNRSPVQGQQVMLDGEDFYQIANYDRMRPFFMTVVSDADHWLFISSHGGLTAGRRDANLALFPYYTDDKLRDMADVTGSKEFGNEDLYRGALGGLVTRPISALLGEAGPEAVIPLDRTPSSRQILEYAEAAMGRSGSGEGNIVNNFSPTIHISGGGEVGMGVAQALAHAQELFESAMEDILRRHRREMFA